MSLARSASSFFLDVLETVVVALSVFLVIYLFFMQPHQVSGQSMEPTFLTGEYVLTDKVSYQTGSPQRGDIVVFKAPDAAGCNPTTNCNFIKRILAIPGDTLQIRDGRVWVNGVPLQETYLPTSFVTEPGDFTQGEREVLLGEDEYFVVGDNREFSSDAREWGPVTKANILGRAFFRYWPVEKMGVIPRVSYE